MSKHVFVIDDDPAVLRLAKIILQTDGYQVNAFASPLAALAALADGDGAPPDLIVLDLSMPEMTGKDFYREARDAGFLKPVVIVSAYGAESARKELGATAALQKPFTPEELSQVVANAA